MKFKGDLLNHFKLFKLAIDAANCECTLDLKTFKLEVERGSVKQVFSPQFLKKVKQRKHYSPAFDQEALVFIGWMPYFNKRWELSNSKLDFKTYCVNEGILTPSHSTSSTQEVLKDVLVKSSASSFSNGIAGPFSVSTQRPLAAGEYYEKFITGKIVKAWFWNNTPICLEMSDFPSVTGNGKQTIEELLMPLIAFQKFQKEKVEKVANFLTYQGKTLTTVLKEGISIAVDFRYGSRFLQPPLIEDITSENSVMQRLKPQLDNVGDRLWQGIPSTIRENSLFTVDAILDSEEKLWCLEMNSNPFVHPMAYPYMIDSLFSNAEIPATISENLLSHHIN